MRIVFLWTFQNGCHSNSQIFGTNAFLKAKLVSKHKFLWPSNPINMFAKTYKDFWFTKSKMATLYNWIRWHEILSINSYFSLRMTCMIFWKISNFHSMTKHQSSRNMFMTYCFMGGWNILAVGIAEISVWYKTKFGSQNFGYQNW